ncbi:MAG: tetratricopeptide repeat protein [Candidatus Binataceae bacterium]
MEESGDQARTFSTRSAARILAVSPDRIRYWVRRRLVQPAALRGRRYRFAFGDLLVMRLAKELIPTRRHLEPVQRCFERLGRLLEPPRPVTSLKLVNEDGTIVVRDGTVCFEAESGQLLLKFDSGARGIVEESFGPARVRERFEEARRIAEQDPLRALALYSDVLGREPRNFEAHVRVAALLEGKGDIKGALRHLLGAAAILPTNAEVHLKLGLLYRKRDEPEESVRSLSRALECDPSSIEAHRNLAELFEQLGRKRDALRHLSAAHRLSRSE